MSLIPPRNSATKIGKVIDNADQIYTYDSSLNQWIQDGANYQQQIVTTKTDGLITPAIAAKLESIKEANLAGTLNGVKFLNNLDCYWYYLNPLTNLLNVKVDNGTNINVEINNSRLTRMVMANSRCVGAKGAKGVTGAAGTNGVAAPAEVFHIPLINGNALTLNTNIQTPLTTPVSVRLFNGVTQLVDIRVALNGVVSFIYPATTTVSLDEANSTLSLNNGVLAGSIIRTDAQWAVGTTYKARQVGPTGTPGSNGETFLAVLESATDDPAISATSVVKTVRKSQAFDLHFITGTVGTTFPVLHLRNNQNTTLVTIPTTIKDLTAKNPDKWVSIDPSSSMAKSLMRWGLLNDTADNNADTTLDLPSWTPLKVVETTGFSGYAGASDIQCCQEDLFVNVSDLTAPPCP